MQTQRIFIIINLDSYRTVKFNQKEDRYLRAGSLELEFENDQFQKNYVTSLKVTASHTAPTAKKTCKALSNISKNIPFQNCSSFQRNFLDVDSFLSYAQKGSRSIANWKKRCEDWTVFSDLAMTSITVHS